MRMTQSRRTAFRAKEERGNELAEMERSEKPQRPKRVEPGSKHEGLRMSSPPARTCATSSPRRKLQKPCDLPILYAQPASVHFGGFALDQTYQQRIFVHNNSAKPVRLQYTMPSKSFFRAAFAQERKPFVSAGLGEELIVTFKPTAFQYHYDCIQVRCEEVAYASNTDTVLLGKCLIPIHAYPVLNEVKFPTRMDFGVVPLGDIGRKHFDLSCSVPIEFEYELELAKMHPSFTIFPLRGRIPANGAARIELEFRPLLYATASAEIVLHVSQMGFAPMKCLLAGSSSSDSQPPTVAASEDSSLPKSPTSQRRNHSSSSSSPQRSPSKSQRSATTASDDKPRKRGTNKDEESESAPPDLEKIGTLEIPADLSSMSSVNFMLTQQPGKLKPKDLKKAVEANREMKKRQKEEQAKLSASNTSGDAVSERGSSSTLASPMALTFHVLVREEENFLKRAEVSRQIKEMFFAQELSDMDQMEKELEFQSHKIHVGQELLTPQQVAFLRQIREMNTLELERRQRERMRNQFSTVAFNTRTQPTPEVPNPPCAMLPAHFVPAYAPDFKTYKNDLWTRRKRVVQKLVRGISTCILRVRAQRRLEKIQKWLGSANTRAQVQEKVALDWKHRIGHGGTLATVSSPEKEEQPSSEQVYFIESFPLVDEKAHAPPREFIAQPADWELKFDTLTFFPVRERDEALLSGHEPLELPPLPTYIPLEKHRELRCGAEDECCGPRHLMEQAATTECTYSFPPQMDTRTASLLQQLPADTFVRPAASVRPLVRIQAPRETDSWYVLRPQRVFRTPPTHFGTLLEESVGMRSLVTLRDTRLALHKVFLPPTERPRAQPLLHWVASPGATSTTEEEESPELYEDVWFISKRPSSFVPKLAEHADDVPCLSDSESDDDEEPTTRLVPTWKDAELLFEDPEAAGGGDTEDRDGESGGMYEEGELLGVPEGVSSFERYRHMIRLERSYNSHREELLQRLPNVSRLGCWFRAREDFLY